MKLLLASYFFFILHSGMAQSYDQTRTESMSEHSLSFNPFFIPLFSANLRYNYFFTERMHWALNARITYVSRYLDFHANDSYIILGAGIKYVPLYYKILALGIDITPTYFVELFPKNFPQMGWMFPLSLNVDLLLSNRVGATIDFGIAYATTEILGMRIIPRGHVGIMFMFGSERKIYPPDLSRY